MAEKLKKNIGTRGSTEAPLITVSTRYFEPTVFVRVVKHALYMSGGTFCEKQVFFLKKRHYFQEFSLKLMEQFLDFEQKISAWLSKLHSICSDERFEKEKF